MIEIKIKLWKNDIFSEIEFKNCFVRCSSRLSINNLQEKYRPEPVSFGHFCASGVYFLFASPTFWDSCDPILPKLCVRACRGDGTVDWLSKNIFQSHDWNRSIDGRIGETGKKFLSFDRVDEKKGFGVGHALVDPFWVSVEVRGSSRRLGATRFVGWNPLVRKGWTQQIAKNKSLIYDLHLKKCPGVVWRTGVEKKNRRTITVENISRGLGLCPQDHIFGDTIVSTFPCGTCEIDPARE